MLVSKLYWLKREQGRAIQFDGIPFSTEKVTILDCQYSDHNWKEKCKRTKKLKIQNTRKIGCPAKIKACTYVLYPDYKVVLSDASQYKLCKHKEDLSNAARIAIRDGSAKTYKNITYLYQLQKHTQVILVIRYPTLTACASYYFTENISVCSRRDNRDQ